MSIRKIVHTATLMEMYGDVSRQTIYRWTVSGFLPKPFKINDKNSWFEDVIEAHQKMLAEGSKDDKAA